MLVQRVLKGFAAPARVAILMSGTGSNAEAILRERHRYPNLDISHIVTDRKGSRAMAIAESHGIKALYFPGSVRGEEEREALFNRIAEGLRREGIQLLLYAGFMKISTRSFCQEFPGLNCHPADLTLLDETGRPKYVGIKVIEEAIAAGEPTLASTIHVVEAEVDCGQPIAVSSPLFLEGLDLEDIPSIHEQLKVRCEHPGFPETLQRLSTGRVTLDQLPLRLA